MSGALGIFGSALGAGKIFSGISDGGSIDTPGEGDGVATGALDCASTDGVGEVEALGDDCAPIRIVAAATKITLKERRIFFTCAKRAMNRGDRI